MAEISDVRDILYATLKTFADAQSPALRIEVAGSAFTPGDSETWLKFHFRTARPSKPYAGTWYQSKEAGFFQVDVMGPESRLQKAFEKIAWDIREAYWPTNSEYAPTLGSAPLVRLGPTAPHVIDHPAPDPGRLGSSVTIYWHADFSRS